MDRAGRHARPGRAGRRRPAHRLARAPGVPPGPGRERRRPRAPGALVRGGRRSRLPLARIRRRPPGAPVMSILMEELAAPTLSTLAPTRRQILESLKKRGELTTDDLADQLELTTSGVRQHLAPLTSDDPELVERLFERRRKRRVDAARKRLVGKTFEQKVEELARILDEDGYLADFQVLPDKQGFLVTEHNCAILGVARRYGQACSSEIGFLREALPEASIERIQHMIAGAHSCAYEVRQKKQSRRRAA